MNVSKIREDFPILARKVDGKDYIYFDSACTSLKPKAMIDVVLAYYSEYTGCAGRSVHKFATRTNREFDEARKKVAKFVNAKKSEEIVWTKNTTEAVNMVAHGLDFKKGDKVVTTNLEHTSGMLPWLIKQKAGKIDLDYVLCNQDGEFNIESFKEKIDSKTKLVSIIYASNVTATRLPVKEIADIAHDRGAMIFVDAAQAVPHFPVDVRKLDIDFMGASGHKMCGPTGIGFLYGKLDLLRKLSPLVTGGETIRDMDACTGCFDFEDVPMKFEAGIQHYAGAIGLGASVDYLSSIGMKNIESHEKELAKDLTEGLLKLGVELLGQKDYGKRGALAAFNVKGMDPHDVAIMLDEQNIFVRSGMHCAYPIHKFLHRAKGSVRASLYFYNTKEEVKTFIEKLGIIMKNFGG
jgi:cysteine desulfurase / selenocysteine lyase